MTTSHLLGTEGTPAAKRCPTCDKPRAGDDLAAHKEGCTCKQCLTVCWREWGVLCKSIDWRSRAIAAEARWAEIVPLVEELRHAIEAWDMADPHGPTIGKARVEAYAAAINILNAVEPTP